MSRPFLITGMGCSGTQFLAQALNRSKQWDVMHEGPDDNRYWRDPHSGITPLLERFVPFHGEVNSQLRRVALRLRREGVRLFLLVRHPVDVLHSVHDARGRDAGQIMETLDEVLDGYQDVRLLFPYAERWWKFEHVLERETALIDIAVWMGIKDLPIQEIDRTVKVNPHRITANIGVDGHSAEIIEMKLRPICDWLGYEPKEVR